MLRLPLGIDIELPDPVPGPPGPPGPAGNATVSVGFYSPTLGAVGGNSGQAYTYRQGNYAVLRDPVNGKGWCWGQAYLQLSKKGEFNGQLCLTLPIKVGNVPGIMGGQFSYFSNPSPQADWPTTSWGWPILRWSGNAVSALIDTNPFPACNPPAMTGVFVNDHTQMSCSFSYPVD